MRGGPLAEWGGEVRAEGLAVESVEGGLCGEAGRRWGRVGV